MDMQNGNQNAFYAFYAEYAKYLQNMESKNQMHPPGFPGPGICSFFLCQKQGICKITTQNMHMPHLYIYNMKRRLNT